MQFRVLGPLEVYEGDRRVMLGGPKPRSLLATLVLRRGEVVPAEQLIEHLYGTAPPAKATKSIHAHVSRLRKALGDNRLRTAGGGYALEISPGELDVDKFEKLVDRGRQALADNDPAAAASTFRQALALWRGPPFADFRYDEFAQPEIARLEELRLGVVEDRIDADLALGRHSDLVSELEAIVAEHPLRERPRAQLMLALYRSGRQAEALEAYADARRILTDELGLDPGDELRTLQRAILEHHPSLTAPGAATTSDDRVRARGDFVGRSAELARLREALDDALAGRGRLVLISGEPGIGKSSLADELVSEARRRDARVLVGRCWEAGGAPAYWPWVQSLRSYVRESDPASLRTHLGSGASELAQLLPELGELFPDLPAPLSTEGAGARFRLFDATATFLKNAAHERPLVVVLDDLHASDEPSLLLLQFLSRVLGDSGLLVVALYRDVDPSLRKPLLPTLAELAREPVTRRVPLSGLDANEVAEFVQRATDSTPSDELVVAIHEETDGNPLFVGEVVRLLTAEGRLATPAAVHSIPQGVREVIERRVGRLAVQTAELLALASVLGREFELKVIARVGGRSTAETLSLLDEAVAERIVGDVPGARGRLRFAHELIRDTLYDELTPARRVRLHREAGEALEALYSADLEPHLAELAHHFAEAAPAHDDRRAVDYARLAGDRAAGLLAFEEAVRLYESALDLGGTQHPDRCEMLLALGEAQARAGDTPSAKDTFRRAAELAERLDAPEQLARAALGYGGRIVWDVSRDDKDLVHLLERAIAALGPRDSTLRVMLLARLAAGPLRDASFPPERKAGLSREALEMARRIGEPLTIAYALSGYIAANHSPEHTTMQVELSSQLIEVATAAGDLERAVEGYEHRRDSRLELADVRGAEADTEAMARLASELHQPSQDWYVAIKQASYALLEGRFAEAEILNQNALDLGERAVTWNAVVSFRLQTFVLRRQQGRLREIDAPLRKWADDYPTYPIWRCVLTLAAADLGSEAEARKLFEALRGEDFRAIPFDEMWLVGMSFLAEAATSLSHMGGADELYRRLLPYADRIAVAYPDIATGAVARYLGLLATTSGNWSDAEHHFQSALELNERIGARPWLALTRRDFATMLRARDAPGDSEQAERLLRSAQNLATEIGMHLS